MGDLWEPVRFDRELIRKYDRPGPRYTSYPTAPHFREAFGAADYTRLLARSAASGRPLSLYVHVPFCRTLCFYCGCNVTTSRSVERGRSYLAFLEAEASMASRLLRAAAQEVVQVHLGGGTPTWLPPADLTDLFAILRRHFHLVERCEIGVEVDPRACSPEHLDALAAAGVNRLSIGVQDLDDGVQRAINRLQSRRQTWRVLEGARRRGMGSINIDLIYGLPYQSIEGFGATVEEVVAMAPDRLAVFNFAYLPQVFHHQRVIDPATLPRPETKLAILEDVVERLTRAGYIFIGMDHFATAEDPLAQALRERTLTRNFQGYSTCAGTDLVGLGVSSIGSLAEGYAQSVRTVAAYEARVGGGEFATFRGLELDGEDLLRREVIRRLMCHFLLPKGEIEAEFGIGFDHRFAAELTALEPLAEDGLVELRPEAIEVTRRGRLLVRNVAMAFDAYRGAQEGAAAFSRTI